MSSCVQEHKYVVNITNLKHEATKPDAKGGYLFGHIKKKKKCATFSHYIFYQENIQPQTMILPHILFHSNSAYA